MLNADFLEKLAELIDPNHDPVVKAAPDSSEYYLLRQPDGSYTPEYGRSHKRISLSTIGSIVYFALDKPDDGQFFVGRNAVRYQYTDQDGHKDTKNQEDWAVLAMPSSKQMEQLHEWEARDTPLTQAKLAPILRTIFAGQISPGDFTAVIEDVNWALAGDDREGNSRTSRAMGKSLETKLQNQDKVADTIVFKVPVWDSGAFQHIATVRAKVEIDSNAKTFTIVPVPGMIADQWHEAVGELAKHVEETIDAVFPQGSSETGIGSGSAAKPRVYLGEE